MLIFCLSVLSVQTVVHEGGLVPKSMYQPGEEVDGTRQHIPLSDQSMYHSVSLGRGQVCPKYFGIIFNICVLFNSLYQNCPTELMLESM